ncbi:MAG: hypothetical protein KIT22_00700 [Verrucomicrobiae bacterium]|nr:hypothetical protein [Verrucomicrobiae bacterium]
MRITLTIDDDVAGLLRTRSRELGKPFKELVNQALRKGLAEEDKPQVARRMITRPQGARGCAPRGSTRIG